MKKYLLVFSTVLFLFPLAVLAQNTTTTTTTTADVVTLEDLGFTSPGILPNSPFYFLKNFGRNIERVFTFNPISRAELELRITNEKAAEIKKLEETADNAVLTKAVENYKESARLLKLRFEALKETSENPNIDKLLDKLTKRVLKHSQLFEELKAKNAELKDKIDDAKENLEKTAIDALERLDREKAKSDKLRQKLSEVKGRLIEKIESKTEEKRACTQEAKKCPNGSFVSRTGPNCEFAKCPVKRSGRPVPTPLPISIPTPTPAPTPTTILPQSETAIATPKTWTIEHTDNRFIPSEIKIKKGDTVTWTNRDSSQAWPASAVHPSHQVYPGFDALKSLSNGESYSFKFDRVGSWKYHNHLNPSVTGAVIVEE